MAYLSGKFKPPQIHGTAGTYRKSNHLSSAMFLVFTAPRARGIQMTCALQRTYKIVPFCNDRESHNSITPIPYPPPPQKKNIYITNLYNIHFPENHHKTEILEKKNKSKNGPGLRIYEHIRVLTPIGAYFGVFA